MMKNLVRRISQFVPVLLLCGFPKAGWTEDLPVVHSQPSVMLETPQVSVAVTQLGGHQAPVTFYRDTPHPVQPYYVSPWQDEPPLEMPAPVLVTLRGDFFCLPFGTNAEEVNGEQHPPHGETACRPWTNQGVKRTGNVSTLTMTIEPKVRPGRVTKELSLVDGQNVVYSTHLIEGFAGKAPLGHHATLAMPEEAGSVHLSTSPLKFGMTYPGQFSDPAAGEYQYLQPGQKWQSLTKVPVAWKGAPDADLSHLPLKKGFADFVQLVNAPSSKADEPAWTTATFTKQGYLWFSLKDPAVLNSTLLWIENHGRHGHPWNGRNHCLGIEDLTTYFAEGLSSSIQDNVLTKAGVKTAIELDPKHPTAIHYIQGVVQIPKGFDSVKDVKFENNQITFIAPDGKQVSAPVNYSFLKSGQLAAK